MNNTNYIKKLFVKEHYPVQVIKDMTGENIDEIKKAIKEFYSEFKRNNYQKIHIQNALISCNGYILETASLLDMSDKTLLKLISKYNIEDYVVFDRPALELRKIEEELILRLIKKYKNYSNLILKIICKNEQYISNILNELNIYYSFNKNNTNFNTNVLELMEKDSIWFLYAKKGLLLHEIRDIMNISKNTLNEKLNLYNIKENFESVILNAYKKQKISSRKLAENLNIPWFRIKQILKENNLEGKYSSTYVSLKQKKSIIEDYVHNSKSIAEISREIGLGYKIVRKIISEENIKVDGKTHVSDDSKKEIIYEYIIDRKSLNQISKDRNIGYNTVRKIFYKQNIEISNLNQNDMLFNIKKDVLYKFSIEENYSPSLILKILNVENDEANSLRKTCETIENNISKKNNCYYALEELILTYLLDKFLNIDILSILLNKSSKQILAEITRCDEYKLIESFVIDKYYSFNTSARKLAAKIDIPYHKVYKILSNNNINLSIRWAKEEVEFLLANIESMTIADIASHLKKSQDSVHKKLAQLGIKLRKKWDSADLDYLEHNTGKKSVIKIAENLNRSYSSTYSQMFRSGIGSPKAASPHLSLTQFSKLLNVGNNTVKKLIDNHGLPARKRVISKKASVWRINTDKFWKWAENNKELINFSRIEKNSLGREPEWVKVQRIKDERYKNNNTIYSKEHTDFIRRNWQINTIDFISYHLKRDSRCVFNKGLSMGLSEYDINKYGSQINSL